MAGLRRFAAVAAAALAVASAAQAKPLLGISGDLPRFETLTGQASTVHQAFLGWGQGLTFGSPLDSLVPTLGPVPMLHLGTNRPNSRKEAITPAQIVAGGGDAYLFALNQAVAQWGKGIYIRPLAEMNNYTVLWSGYTRKGAAKPGHSPADYRRAFARIFLIVHGGSAAAINAKLRSLGEPPVSRDLASNPFPRVRVVWSPLAGGNPRIPGNAAENYYPGARYVDVDGGDIYDEQLTDTAPWSALEELFTASVAHGRPFSVPEWGLSVDDTAFIKHMCTFLTSHPRTEMAAFYESRPGSRWDIAPKPAARTQYRACLTPLGAAVPGWASAAAARPGPGGGTSGASIQFTAGGQPLGSPVRAPIGADEIELDMVPATGVVAKAYWIRAGKSLGPMDVPAGATGAAFQAGGGGTSPAELTRPRAGTDFHVRWNAAGAITSAWWTRVGKLLADIPVSSGQTSIAMTQGS